MLGFGVAFAQNNGWRSHAQCETGERAVPNANGAFSTTYSTSSTSSKQKEGTQNHYNGTVNAEAKHETRLPVSSNSGKVAGGAGISRDGEKKTTNDSKTNTETHTVRYDCKPVKKQ